MRVALSPSFEPIKAEGSAIKGDALLGPNGPERIFGWDEASLAVPIAPAADCLFGPRGACLLADGSLWVSDTGHHRLLGWENPFARGDNAPADYVIGQPDFGREGRNAKGPVGAETLNVPTGVCGFRDGLAVADAWNHRVLVWFKRPTASHQAPDIVLGQRDFTGGLSNWGKDQPTAQSMHWPYGVAEIDGKLVVADTGNRRVLIWDDPRESGAPADSVLGQDSFTCRDENAGAAVGEKGMRWPHGLALWRAHLVVSDAGNNRLMLWKGLPTQNGAPADIIIGQKSVADCDHNGGFYYPTAQTVNMPYGAAVLGDRLVAADTANSRLIGWSSLNNNPAADRLMGQADFASKGDNRWGMPARDSFCWPYGITAQGDMLVIADSGNNRVMLWRAVP